MLTKQDLLAISQLFDNRFLEAEEKLQTNLENGFQSNIQSLEMRLQANLQKELKPIKRELKKLYKNQNMIIGFFDNTYTELRTRVEKIEQIILH